MRLDSPSGDMIHSVIKSTMDNKELTHALYSQFLKFKPNKGDLRRIAILENAIECIATIGVEASSLEAIGKKHKMTKAHVAYYYDDRKTIVEAAIKFVVATVQSFTVRHVKEAATEKDRLEAFINGTFDWVGTYPKHPSVIMLMYYYSSFDPFYRKLHTEVRATGAERIQAVIEPLLSSAKKKQAGTLAKLVQSILTGHLLDYITTASPLSLEQLRRKTVKEILETVDCLGS